MKLIDWVRYPKRTFVTMKFASYDAIHSYLYAFMQVWNQYGGPYRLRDVASDMVSFCMKILNNESTASAFLHEACVHTLCVMGTVETAIQLRTSTPRVKELVNAYIIGRTPSVAMYTPDLDEWYILQAVLRLNTIQSEMDTCGYWSHPNRFARDLHWLKKEFVCWKYDLDDSLLFGIEDAENHIEYLQDQMTKLRTGERVFLRLPMPFIHLDAGMIGTIIEIQFEIAFVRWEGRSRINSVHPMLLGKI